MGTSTSKELQKECTPRLIEIIGRLEEWDEARYDVFSRLYRYIPIQVRREHIRAMRLAEKSLNPEKAARILESSMQLDATKTQPYHVSECPRAADGVQGRQIESDYDTVLATDDDVQYSTAPHDRMTDDAYSTHSTTSSRRDKSEDLSLDREGSRHSNNGLHAPLSKLSALGGIHADNTSVHHTSLDAKQGETTPVASGSLGLKVRRGLEHYMPRFRVNVAEFEAAVTRGDYAAPKHELESQFAYQERVHLLSTYVTIREYLASLVQTALYAEVLSARLTAFSELAHKARKQHAALEVLDLDTRAQATTELLRREVNQIETCMHVADYLMADFELRFMAKEVGDELYYCAQRQIAQAFSESSMKDRDGSPSDDETYGTTTTHVPDHSNQDADAANRYPILKFWEKLVSNLEITEHAYCEKILKDPRALQKARQDALDQADSAISAIAMSDIDRECDGIASRLQATENIPDPIVGCQWLCAALSELATQKRLNDQRLLTIGIRLLDPLAEGRISCETLQSLGIPPRVFQKLDLRRQGHISVKDIRHAMDALTREADETRKTLASCLETAAEKHDKRDEAIHRGYSRPKQDKAQAELIRAEIAVVNADRKLDEIKSSIANVLRGIREVVGVHILNKIITLANQGNYGLRFTSLLKELWEQQLAREQPACSTAHSMASVPHASLPHQEVHQHSHPMDSDMASSHHPSHTQPFLTPQQKPMSHAAYIASTPSLHSPRSVSEVQDETTSNMEQSLPLASHTSAQLSQMTGDASEKKPRSHHSGPNIACEIVSVRGFSMPTTDRACVRAREIDVTCLMPAQSEASPLFERYSHVFMPTMALRGYENESAQDAYSDPESVSFQQSVDVSARPFTELFRLGLNKRRKHKPFAPYLEAIRKEIARARAQGPHSSSNVGASLERVESTERLEEVQDQLRREISHAAELADEVAQREKDHHEEFVRQLESEKAQFERQHSLETGEDLDETYQGSREEADATPAKADGDETPGETSLGWSTRSTAPSLHTQTALGPSQYEALGLPKVDANGNVMPESFESHDADKSTPSDSNKPYGARQGLRQPLPHETPPMAQVDWSLPPAISVESATHHPASVSAPTISHHAEEERESISPMESRRDQDAELQKIPSHDRTHVGEEADSSPAITARNVVTDAGKYRVETISAFTPESAPALVRIKSRRFEEEDDAECNRHEAVVSAVRFVRTEEPDQDTDADQENLELSTQGTTSKSQESSHQGQTQGDTQGDTQGEAASRPATSHTEPQQSQTYKAAMPSEDAFRERIENDIQLSAQEKAKTQETVLGASDERKTKIHEGPTDHGAASTTSTSQTSAMSDRDTHGNTQHESQRAPTPAGVRVGEEQLWASRASDNEETVKPLESKTEAKTEAARIPSTAQSDTDKPSGVKVDGHTATSVTTSKQKKTKEHKKKDKHSKSQIVDTDATALKDEAVGTSAQRKRMVEDAVSKNQNMRISPVILSTLAKKRRGQTADQQAQDTKPKARVDPEGEARGSEADTLIDLENRNAHLVNIPHASTDSHAKKNISARATEHASVHAQTQHAPHEAVQRSHNTVHDKTLETKQPSHTVTTPENTIRSESPASAQFVSGLDLLRAQESRSSTSPSLRGTPPPVPPRTTLPKRTPEEIRVAQLQAQQHVLADRSLPTETVGGSDTDHHLDALPSQQPRPHRSISDALAPLTMSKSQLAKRHIATASSKSSHVADVSQSSSAYHPTRPDLERIVADHSDKEIEERPIEIHDARDIETYDAYPPPALKGSRSVTGASQVAGSVQELVTPTPTAEKYRRLFGTDGVPPTLHPPIDSDELKRRLNRGVDPRRNRTTSSLGRSTSQIDQVIATKSDENVESRTDNTGDASVRDKSFGTGLDRAASPDVTKLSDVKTPGDTSETSRGRERGKIQRITPLPVNLSKPTLDPLAKPDILMPPSISVSASGSPNAPPESSPSQISLDSSIVSPSTAAAAVAAGSVPISRFIPPPNLNSGKSTPALVSPVSDTAKRSSRSADDTVDQSGIKGTKVSHGSKTSAFDRDVKAQARRLSLTQCQSMSSSSSSSTTAVAPDDAEAIETLQLRTPFQRSIAAIVKCLGFFPLPSSYVPPSRPVRPGCIRWDGDPVFPPISHELRRSLGDFRADTKENAEKVLQNGIKSLRPAAISWEVLDREAAEQALRSAGIAWSHGALRRSRHAPYLYAPDAKETKQWRNQYDPRSYLPMGIRSPEEKSSRTSAITPIENFRHALIAARHRLSHTSSYFDGGKPSRRPLTRRFFAGQFREDGPWMPTAQDLYEDRVEMKLTEWEAERRNLLRTPESAVYNILLRANVLPLSYFSHLSEQQETKRFYRTLRPTYEELLRLETSLELAEERGRDVHPSDIYRVPERTECSESLRWRLLDPRTANPRSFARSIEKTAHHIMHEALTRRPMHGTLVEESPEAARIASSRVSRALRQKQTELARRAIPELADEMAGQYPHTPAVEILNPFMRYMPYFNPASFRLNLIAAKQKLRHTNFEPSIELLLETVPNMRRAYEMATTKPPKGIYGRKVLPKNSLALLERLGWGVDLIDPIVINRERRQMEREAYIDTPASRYSYPRAERGEREVDYTSTAMGEEEHKGAALAGAALTGAALTGAALTGAALTGAALTGATLTGAAPKLLTHAEPYKLVEVEDHEQDQESKSPSQRGSTREEREGLKGGSKYPKGGSKPSAQDEHEEDREEDFLAAGPKFRHVTAFTAPPVRDQSDQDKTKLSVSKEGQQAASDSTKPEEKSKAISSLSQHDQLGHSQAVPETQASKLQKDKPEVPERSESHEKSTIQPLKDEATSKTSTVLRTLPPELSTKDVTKDLPWKAGPPGVEKDTVSSRLKRKTTPARKASSPVTTAQTSSKRSTDDTTSTAEKKPDVPEVHTADEPKAQRTTKSEDHVVKQIAEALPVSISCGGAAELAPPLHDEASPTAPAPVPAPAHDEPDPSRIPKEIPTRPLDHSHERRAASEYDQQSLSDLARAFLATGSTVNTHGNYSAFSQHDIKRISGDMRDSGSTPVFGARRDSEAASSTRSPAPPASRCFGASPFLRTGHFEQPHHASWSAAQSDAPLSPLRRRLAGRYVQSPLTGAASVASQDFGPTTPPFASNTVNRFITRWRQAAKERKLGKDDTQPTFSPSHQPQSTFSTQAPKPEVHFSLGPGSHDQENKRESGVSLLHSEDRDTEQGWMTDQDEHTKRAERSKSTAEQSPHRTLQRTASMERISRRIHALQQRMYSKSVKALTQGFEDIAQQVLERRQRHQRGAGISSVSEHEPTEHEPGVKSSKSEAQVASTNVHASKPSSEPQPSVEADQSIESSKTPSPSQQATPTISPPQASQTSQTSQASQTSKDTSKSHPTQSTKSAPVKHTQQERTQHSSEYEIKQSARKKR